MKIEAIVMGRRICLATHLIGDLLVTHCADQLRLRTLHYKSWRERHEKSMGVFVGGRVAVDTVDGVQ